MPWRVRRGVLEVALVHRPRYDDWSWPKGKLDPDEDWAAAAARETVEETGLEVRLGRPLPEARYVVLTRTGVRADKVVRYWAATVTGGHGRLENEIDAVEWHDVAEAYARLDYAHDRDQLRALVRAQSDDALETWPLVVVRHAKAVPRSSWKGADHARPVDGRGRAQAAALVPVLAAYRVTRVLTSPSTRCLQTISPYAVSAGLEPRTRKSLSEQGHEAEPGRAVEHLRRLLGEGEAALLCSHGQVLPDLLDVLATHLDLTGTSSVAMLEAFVEARDENLVKGEALVCHVAGTGDAARIVAVERHLP